MNRVVLAIPTFLIGSLLSVGCTLVTQEKDDSSPAASSGTGDAGSGASTNGSSGSANGASNASSGSSSADGGASSNSSNSNSNGNATSTTGASGLGTTSAPGATLTDVADNDDFARAQKVNPGDVVNGMFSNAADYFTITIPGSADGYLRVTVTETSADAKSTIDFYHADRARETTSYAKDWTAVPHAQDFRATAGKSYFVRTQASLSGTAKIPFSVKFEFTPVLDPLEGNNDFAEAKPLAAGTATDVIVFAGADTLDGADLDFFTLDAPATAKSVHVEVKNNSTAELPQRFQLDTYDAARARLSGYYGPGQRADVSTDLPVPPGGGKMYLRVRTADDEQSPLKSQLTATFK